ncbi:MAG: hypothetical protein JKY23_04325 [Nitrospinaceae bacterium]|nr:hypothetical protein [Nitrospinaceae bacterium]
MSGRHVGAMWEEFRLMVINPVRDLNGKTDLMSRSNPVAHVHERHTLLMAYVRRKLMLKAHEIRHLLVRICGFDLDWDHKRYGVTSNMMQECLTMFANTVDKWNEAVRIRAGSVLRVHRCTPLSPAECMSLVAMVGSGALVTELQDWVSQDVDNNKGALAGMLVHGVDEGEWRQYWTHVFGDDDTKYGHVSFEDASMREPCTVVVASVYDLRCLSLHGHLRYVRLPPPAVSTASSSSRPEQKVDPPANLFELMPLAYNVARVLMEHPSQDRVSRTLCALLRWWPRDRDEGAWSKDVVGHLAILLADGACVHGPLQLERSRLLTTRWVQVLLGSANGWLLKDNIDTRVNLLESIVALSQEYTLVPSVKALVFCITNPPLDFTTHARVKGLHATRLPAVLSVALARVCFDPLLPPARFRDVVLPMLQVRPPTAVLRPVSDLAKEYTARSLWQEDTSRSHPDEPLAWRRFLKSTPTESKETRRLQHKIQGRGHMHHLITRHMPSSEWKRPGVVTSQAFYLLHRALAHLESGLRGGGVEIPADLPLGDMPCMLGPDRMSLGVQNSLVMESDDHRYAPVSSYILDVVKHGMVSWDDLMDMDSVDYNNPPSAVQKVLVQGQRTHDRDEATQSLRLLNAAMDQHNQSNGVLETEEFSADEGDSDEEENIEMRVSDVGPTPENYNEEVLYSPSHPEPSARGPLLQPVHPGWKSLLGAESAKLAHRHRVAVAGIGGGPSLSSRDQANAFVKSSKRAYPPQTRGSMDQIKRTRTGTSPF